MDATLAHGFPRAVGLLCLYVLNYSVILDSVCMVPLGYTEVTPASCPLSAEAMCCKEINGFNAIDLVVTWRGIGPATLWGCHVLAVQASEAMKR